ncbi:MAG: 4Fe-4S binding protein [Methanocorpusculum sp.]|nr:4Fe-4S binding protein [Methanocorpusculum sp.]
MQVARIKKEKCDTTMCNRCVKFCPRSTKTQPVIYIGRNKKATVVEELCNGCGKCVKICREKAIEMVTVADKVNPDTEVEQKLEELEEKKEEQKQTAPPKKKETPEEKIAGKKSRHVERVIRTAIACGLGIVAGIVSFFLAGTPSAIAPAANVTDVLNTTYAGGVQANPFVGILVLLVAIVIQKTIFMLIKIDTSKLGKKDWFYQGFMTFGTWYLSWTMMLSTSTLTA